MKLAHAGLRRIDDKVLALGSARGVSHDASVQLLPLSASISEDALRCLRGEAVQNVTDQLDCLLFLFVHGLSPLIFPWPPAVAVRHEECLLSSTHGLLCKSLTLRQPPSQNTLG